MEIDLQLDFSPEELSLLDMHGVLNVLTVVQFQLLGLAEPDDHPAELEELITKTCEFADSLTNRDAALGYLELIEAYTDQVMETLESEPLVTRMESTEGFYEVRGNLKGIFEVLKLRAAEILERSENPHAWKAHPIIDVKKSFTQMFQAIEKNSRGAYHIVNNLAAHEEGDYLVHLKIDAPGHSEVLMPPVFQDVMRDLLANARKYTAPGGVITAGLLQNNRQLRFVVEDTGVGIPEDEIEQVVTFGFRASNVRSRPTRGGGFGLTKAYYISKSFGGRMWITSPVFEGAGTRIEIRIPCPENPSR